VILGHQAIVQADERPGKGPLSPTGALEQLQIASGLRVELVASEPEVMDPVAIRFGGDGRLWVVEMRDYPHGPAPGEPPQSRIKILRDTDGDGRYETASVFADELLFVTGIQPWRGGVIATMAGQVAFLKDTNGDGKADHSETWFQGFAQENTQLRANHPRFGLDNHITIANGLRGGTVVDPRDPQARALPLSGKDFRFNPTTFAYESLTGPGQFGLTFDDFGNRFVCTNRNPLKHIVLEERYIARNRAYAPSATAYDVATAGAASRVYPLSRAWTTSNLHAGQFTAACGVLIYRGNGLAKRYYGSGFTCDPTGNLVHCEHLRTRGATFSSTPAQDGVEFLASKNEWFRPVNLAHGPDGGLYVVDMCRAVIEHPQFMPTELKERPDLLLGRSRGRIYRVTAKVDTVTRKPPHLGSAHSGSLVSLFEHPNAWHRDTAARLLFERQDKSVVEKLAQLVIDGRQASARVHALWTLEGLKSLDNALLHLALDDSDARVCEQAVVIAEGHFSADPRLRPHVGRLAGSEDPRLRFQVALSLSPIAEDEVEILRDIVIAGIDDEWTRRAVGIAAGAHSADLVLAVFANPPWQERRPAGRDLTLVAELVAAGVTADAAARSEVLRAIIKLTGGPAFERLQRVALAALATRLPSRKSNLAIEIEKLTDKAEQRLVRDVLARAALFAVDQQQLPSERRQAIELLVHDPNAVEILVTLSLEEASGEVRTQAVAALSRRNEIEPWKVLVDSFAAESPTMRRAIVAGLLARTQRTTLLLDGIEAGKIKPAELDRAQAGRLLKHRDAALRKRATVLLAAAVPADRKQVLADYQVVLKMKSDPLRGRAVFKKNCMTCHRVGGLGVEVAPDISDSRTKQKTQILVDILQPNRAIDNNYIGYTVITNRGTVLNGIVTSETATSLTLRQAEGKNVTLLRSDIEEIRSTGVSLMPAGLEKSIPHQEMADLISFIKNWRYLDGKTPLGNSQ
jgi:putative membrane-bound dehydrogenase-like protein